VAESGTEIRLPIGAAALPILAIESAAIAANIANLLNCCVEADKGAGFNVRFRE
jgi:hypothetical protein